MKISLILFLVLCSNFSIYAQSKYNLEINTGANILQSQIKIYSDEGWEANGVLPELEKTAYFMVQLIGSYKFNEYFSFGCGVEYNRFMNDFNLISLLANAKFIYPLKLLRPFLNFSFGHGMITTLDKGNSGGLQYEAGIGLFYFLSKKIDLILKGNYKVMNTESAPPSLTLGVPRDYPRIKNEFINLSVGANFKF